VDLEAEVALQDLLRQAIADRRLRSAHDCSDGGVAVAVAESCMAGKIGAVLCFDDVPWVAGSLGCAASAGAAETHSSAAGPLALRPDLVLFGESPTLAVVSIEAADVDVFEDLCEAAGVPYTRLGTVGGADLALTVGAAGLRASVSALDEIYESALRRALGE